MRTIARCQSAAQRLLRPPAWAPLALLLLLAGVSCPSCALEPLPEGFHHDIDETSFSIGSLHACALQIVPGVEFGGKPICWGNKKYHRLEAVDVRGALLPFLPLCPSRANTMCVLRACTACRTCSFSCLSASLPRVA